MQTLVTANQTHEAAVEARVRAVANVTCCNRSESDLVGKGISRQCHRSPNFLYGGASRVLGFAGKEVSLESAQITGGMVQGQFPTA